MPSDNFNRSNSDNLGLSWQEIEFANSNLRIESNTVRTQTQTNNRGLAYWDATFSDDQYSQLEYGSISIDSHFSGPAVRIDPSSTTSSATCYCAVVDDDGAGSPANSIRLYKFVSNDFIFSAGTQLGSSVSVSSWTNGDVIRIEAEGTTIRVLINSVEQISVTDSSISSGKPGIAAPALNITSRVGYFDNWESGDIEPTGFTPAADATGTNRQVYFDTFTRVDGGKLELEIENIYRGTIDRVAGRWGAQDSVPLTLGTGQDAELLWDGTKFSLKISSTEALQIDGSQQIGINATPDARLEIQTASDEGKQAVTLDQDDTDQPFIDFQGQASANATDSLSTWTTGNSIQGFIQIEINGTKRWIPYYDDPTS